MWLNKVIQYTNFPCDKLCHIGAIPTPFLAAVLKANHAVSSGVGASYHPLLCLVDVCKEYSFIKSNIKFISKKILKYYKAYKLI